MALRTLGTGGVDDGPVEKFLPLLNLALCLVVWLKSRTAKDEVAGWEGGLPTREFFPPRFPNSGSKWLIRCLVVFVLVFLVRSQLAPIDVAGLERLRYGYKGA